MFQTFILSGLFITGLLGVITGYVVCKVKYSSFKELKYVFSTLLQDNERDIDHISEHFELYEIFKTEELRNQALRS